MVSCIQEVVALHYGLTFTDLVSGNRTPTVSHARQVAMYLARKLTRHSLAEIGNFFGRDHTIAYFAIQRIDRLSKEDPTLAEDLKVLTDALAQ